MKENLRAWSHGRSRWELGFEVLLALWWIIGTALMTITGVE